ncbi:MAG: N-methyl-L-tryptophan oxidase, partial [Verrucomicrobia bacterium]|nr:N-methyl-L-tryptophan oxidase [Verrucomicrobiota bacterium]
MIYDTIVIGIGGMGSAALDQLAARGQRVLGLEQFDIGHDQGSSHGFTRIFRFAYFEDPAYVPLIRRAMTLWRELESSGHATEPLVHVTGSIDVGPPGDALVTGALASARQHGLVHEELTSAQLSERFPAYEFPADYTAVWQPESGYLIPEASIGAAVRRAQQRGAELRTRTRVVDIQPHASSIRVQTETDTYEAVRVVVCSGAWSAKLIPALRQLAVPERQVLGWFTPRQPALFDPHHFPVFVCRVDAGLFYGFPNHAGQGFKLGLFHHRREKVDPDDWNRDCDGVDEQILRDFTERYF